MCSWLPAMGGGLLAGMVVLIHLLAGPHPHMFKLWAAALILIVLVRADGHIYLSTIYLSTYLSRTRLGDQTITCNL